MAWRRGDRAVFCAHSNIPPAAAVALDFHFNDDGRPVPKPNYHQARKQKELARKARQQEKQQRRSSRPSTPGENAQVGKVEGEGSAAAPRAPSSGSGT